MPTTPRILVLESPEELGRALGSLQELSSGEGGEFGALIAADRVPETRPFSDPDGALEGRRLEIAGLGNFTAYGLYAKDLALAIAGIGYHSGAERMRPMLDLGLVPLDLYVLEDVLRRGDLILILGASRSHLLGRDPDLYERAQRSWEEARERWWLSVASKAARERGAALQREGPFRVGFAAALAPMSQGEESTYEQVIEDLERQHSEHFDSPAFQQGFAEGQRFLQTFIERPPRNAS